MSALIYVTPETCQENTFEERHNIAEFARQVLITPDASNPQCVTLCFLAEHTNWNPHSLLRQPVEPLFSAFRRGGDGNPLAADITRDHFDRHLRRFLHTTALNFTINPETSTVVHAQGLRLNTQARSVQQRQAVIEALSRLDHPAF